MNDELWVKFFKTAVKVLGPGNYTEYTSDSWCAWTTFDTLECTIHYWRAGIPDEKYIEATYINEGPWTQPFSYRSLAHIIIPKTFAWESTINGEYRYGRKHQDIATLSNELDKAGIIHRLTPILLEIKLY